MATTVAQPGTALRRVAKEYADQAGMPVEQFLDRLRRLNPDYNRAQGSDALRLGRGVSPTATAVPTDNVSIGSNVIDDPEGQVFTDPTTTDPNPVVTDPDTAGDAAGSQGPQVADILNSPLYTQSLKDYYLSQYLPGLTQATFNINQAQTDFGSNEVSRARQRGEAIRRVAGGFAARGMRSPGAINRERSGIQAEFANLSRREQGQIQALLNERDVMFGAGAQNSENFLSDPTLFGSIGAGARRGALSGLQDLPGLYNLLGLGASTAPMTDPEVTTGTTGAGTTGTTGTTGAGTTGTTGTTGAGSGSVAPLVTRTGRTGRTAPTPAERRAMAAQRQQAAERARAAAAAARTNTARNSTFKPPKLATKIPGRTAR